MSPTILTVSHPKKSIPKESVLRRENQSREKKSEPSVRDGRIGSVGVRTQSRVDFPVYVLMNCPHADTFELSFCYCKWRDNWLIIKSAQNLPEIDTF